MARHHGKVSGSQSGAAGFLRVDEVARKALHRAAARLPLLEGSSIRLQFRSNLTVLRGKLHSGASSGTAVHAASFLPSRRIVLDSELLCYPDELRRILIHELFHFVWRRLGNPKRFEWEDVLRLELQARARGELGWSAEWRKLAMAPSDVQRRTLRWRNYVCESFCDTAAWLWGPPHAEHTLAQRHRSRRELWLRGITGRPLSI